MDKKIIILGADGTTIDLNYAYYQLLTKHPNYKSKYGDLKWEDMDKALPVLPEYGALELKTHPELGKELDYDFCHSPEFFNDRPMYEGVEEFFYELKEFGYEIIITSSSFDLDVKRRFLEERFAKVIDLIKIVCIEKNPESMHDNSFKIAAFKKIIKDYNIIDASSVIYVDNRVYDLSAGLAVGFSTYRMKSDFSKELSKEYSIKEFLSIQELKNFIIG